MDRLSEYERIPSSLRNLIQDERTAKALYAMKWIATEKLHGANFSLVYFEKKLRFAKRKEYLTWQDDFFGFQLFISKNENRILELFEQLERTYKAMKIIIYGELVGGIYPHADVKPDDNVRPVQTGIYYSPTIEFCAFDIAIEYDQGGDKIYLDYKIAVQYLIEYGFLYAKIISTGSLQDMLALNLRINSLLPQQLGMPELKSNIIEGIVIKPLHFSLNNVISTRPTVKIKNPEFEETTVFHQAEKWSYVGNNSSDALDLEFMVDSLRNYVTSNRLNNVISKTGHINSKNLHQRQKIEGLLLSDVMINFDEDNGNILDDLNDKQKSWVSKRVLSAIIQLVDSIYPFA